MPVDAPRRVGGRYALLEPIGRGGMGTVWRGRDEVLGRLVAIKEILPPVGLTAEEQETLSARTLREARAAARIGARSAVTVHDVVDEDDRPWIVMELLNARSLADVLRDEGPLGADVVARIGLELLDALQAAHSAGVVHRDVKPGNVLLCRDGRTVLTDFGIAALDGDPTLTATGTVLGSPAYMAPERTQGREPSPEMDLWSLGATLYAALDGRAPFQRTTALSTLHAVLMEPLPPPPPAAGPLAPLLTGLLAKDPAQRLDVAGARGLLRDAVRRTAAAPDVVAPSAAAPALPAAPPWRAAAAPAHAGESVGDPSRGVDLSGGHVVAVTAARTESAPALAPTRVFPAQPPPLPAARSGRPPVGLLPPPPPPPPRGRRRRRGALAVVLASVLAMSVLGATAWTVLANRRPAGGATAQAPAEADAGPGNAQPAAAPSAAPSSSPSPPSVTPSASPSPVASVPPSPLPSVTRAPTRSATPTSSPAQTTSSPSTSGRTYSNSQFSIQVPAGWTVSPNGHEMRFSEPSTGRFLDIDYTNTPNPSTVGDRREKESRISGSAGYRRIYLGPGTYRNYDTADWQYVVGGRRCSNPTFITGPRHAFSMEFCVPTAQWDSSQDELAAFRGSFQPAPG